MLLNLRTLVRKRRGHFLWVARPAQNYLLPLLPLPRLLRRVTLESGGGVARIGNPPRRAVLCGCRRPRLVGTAMACSCTSQPGQSSRPKGRPRYIDVSMFRYFDILIFCMISPVYEIHTALLYTRYQVCRDAFTGRMDYYLG